MIIPPTLQLETDLVILRPIRAQDQSPLLELAQQDPDMWAFFSLNLADWEQFSKWMQLALNDQAAGTRVPFTIIDKRSGQIAGSSAFGSIFYQDHRLEIGWSWLAPGFRGSGVNLHAKYAMLRYAFEELNMERVEFKTDVLNARARRGLQKIGGTEEGILRSHMKMWNDRRRTSIFYSILKEEWPALRSGIYEGLAWKYHTE